MNTKEIIQKSIDGVPVDGSEINLPMSINIDVNAASIIKLIKASFAESLKDFIKKIIVNPNAGYPQTDKTFALYNITITMLEDFANDKENLDIYKIDELLNLYAKRLNYALVEGLIENT